jgi:riboflavin kinase/FMN adenylyltransferase
VLTIGNFDGVHLGHRALLERVIARARAEGRTSCAYTFHPSPVDVLRPDRRPPRIQSLEERVATIAGLGVDRVVVERFDRAFAEHDARWFAEEVVQRRLRAVAVVIGWDFRFGRGRAGGPAELVSSLPVDVEQVGPILVDGDPVSSSRIRQLVRDGDVAAAARLLGRPHRVTGEVVVGDGRGRTLGFPTANVAARTELLPALGVYAVRVDVGGPAALQGVVNLGVRPTFDGHGTRLEAHLLDFSGDLYGQTLRVEFVARLRGEQRFASLQELVDQVQRDLRAARRLLDGS